MNGLRVKAHAIPVPTPTRSVAAAIQVACVTELRKSSGVQMQSMPAASAARASSVRSAAVIPIAAIETRPSASGAKRLDALDDRAGAEAAAAAHRHEAYLLVRALELVQEGGDQPRAGGAERVPERDRAAVDVDAVHVRLELAAPGRDNGGERLVDLDQVDVVDLHVVALEKLARRRDRAG